MTALRRIASAVVMAAAVAAPAWANDERLKDAAAVLTEMTATSDKGIPAALLSKAQCLVIIPSVKKAALGFGGQYGRGYIACRKGGGWSAPAAVRVEGGSIGLQIGVSGTDVIMAVMRDRGIDRLLSNQFTVGVDSAVAAGPVGRQASAQTDATITAEILAWSRAKGAYAGISLQGSTLRDDDGENRELYGRDISNKEIVQSDIAAPPAAAPLMKALGAIKEP
ncbi:MAG: lipid-binding SYLF domain-containing protein [Acidobacteria bacterium]|nr:lipid-binding SYLF domain-containing protein [Acidobacteriota bacterium]